MDRRIDLARGLVAGGTGVLLVALFLPWWGGESAWTVFEALDLVLAAGALGAGAVALGRVEDPDGRLALGAAGLLALVVVSQLLDAPPAGQDQGRDAGLWIAVLAVLAVVAGSVLQRASIAVTVDVRGRATERPTPVPDPEPASVRAPEPPPEPPVRESLLGFGEPPTEAVARPERPQDTGATTAFDALADDLPTTESRRPR